MELYFKNKTSAATKPVTAPILPLRTGFFSCMMCPRSCPPSKGTIGKRLKIDQKKLIQTIRLRKWTTYLNSLGINKRITRHTRPIIKPHAGPAAVMIIFCFLLKDPCEIAIPPIAWINIRACPPNERYANAWPNSWPKIDIKKTINVIRINRVCWIGSETAPAPNTMGSIKNDQWIDIGKPKSLKLKVPEKIALSLAVENAQTQLTGIIKQLELKQNEGNVSLESEAIEGQVWTNKANIQLDDTLQGVFAASKKGNVVGGFTSKEKGRLLLYSNNGNISRLSKRK